MDQGKEGQGQPLANLGTASQGWWTGKLSPGCLASTRWASLANEGHVQYTKVHAVHPQPDGIQNYILNLIIIITKILERSRS